MANKNVFCNTPWYEAHIYWNGDLGICCQESRKLYPVSESQYNIKTMSLHEWFNSEPVRHLRKDILSDERTEICKLCYQEQEVGNTSRRHRANQKSVIFTKQAFKESYLQSPGHTHFEHSQSTGGHTNTLPIDLHIDLGNYCNLACKMCWPGASTKIATQHVKWGIQEDKQYLGNDWTKDEKVWNRFLNELLEIPKLKNIHLMGGETLLTKRFEEMVDFMIDHKRFDLNWSFVTNGTIFNRLLMDKLKQFQRVGIEVSIETASLHNEYVRQGTDNKLVMETIDKYLEYNNEYFSVTLRPAISALTIGYYDTLLEFAIEKKLLIKSLIVNTPEYLNIDTLSPQIKQAYLKKYYKLLENLEKLDISVEFNESDTANYQKSILAQVNQTITLLENTTDNGKFKELVNHCRRWDQELGLNALELYPELEEEFKKYGY